MRAKRERLVERHPLGIAIIGLGNWGSRLVRVFSRQQRSRIHALCDVRPERLAAFSALPGCPILTTRFSESLDSQDIAAVVISTPPAAHAEMALGALRAGKHVFVEKPMALCSADALALTQEADRTGLRVMVGHILEYHPAFERLRELVAAGHLGKVHHVLAERLGRTSRGHENAWWSLAPHDLGLVRTLFGGDPRRIEAHACRSTVEDVVVADLEYSAGRTARIHVSTTSSEKTRRLTVVGSERIAVFDDRHPVQKLQLYEPVGRGAPANQVGRIGHRGQLNGFHHVLRGSKRSAVEIGQDEPLEREACHFVRAVLDGNPVRTDARGGLAIVRALEAGEEALRASQGQPARKAKRANGPLVPPAQ